jgi:hypothetical protein
MSCNEGIGASELELGGCNDCVGASDESAREICL